MTPSRPQVSSGPIRVRPSRFSLTIFLIGAVGTVAGALLAYFALSGPYAASGGQTSDLAAVASMMTGSYIGGSVNFSAMAMQHGLKGTPVAAAATVADNLLMALYFFVLIAFAGMRFFRARFPHPHIDEVERGSSSGEQAKTQAAAFWSRKDISLKDVAMNIAFAVVVVWVSNLVAGLFSPLAAEGVASTFQSCRSHSPAPPPAWRGPPDGSSPGIPPCRRRWWVRRYWRWRR